MTPKQKADELYDKFYMAIPSDEMGLCNEASRQCALIAVDEIIKEGIENAVDDFYSDQGYYIDNLNWKILGYNEYWTEVKKEIEAF